MPGVWPRLSTSTAGGIAAAVLPFLVLGAALALDPDVRFAQWDNFEQFLPSIWTSQQRLLAGDFPHWNHFQGMGQELHALGAYGVLYPGYTIAAALVGFLGLGPDAFFPCIAVLHAGLAGLFVYALALELGARPTLALVAALGLALGGHALYMTTFWIFVLPYLAWTAAALFALARLVENGRSAGAFGLAAASLALLFHLGLTDRALYSALAAGAFAVGLAAIRGRLRARTPLLAAAALSAAFLSLPTVYPTIELVAASERAGALTREEFSARGVKPAALRGLLLPVYRGSDGYSEPRLVCTLYAGAWLVPSLVLGAVALASRRRARGEAHAREPATSAAGRTGRRERTDAELAASIALLVVLGGLLLWLSLGQHGGLHPLTYDLPVWSRFRWPFKLFLRAILLLGVAAALCMEILARSRPSWLRAALAAAFVAVAGWLWIAQPASVGVSTLGVGLGGLASMACVAGLHWRWARAALLASAVVGFAGMPSLVSYPGRDKSYRGERYGAVGPEALGISLDYRVLGISAAPPGRHLQELAHFDAATMNGYFALTGTRSPLLSTERDAFFATTVDGRPFPEALPRVLTSHLLASFNTRYVVAARYDRPVRGLLEALPGYRRIGGVGVGEVWENPNALARVYFATALDPTPGGFLAGLGENRAAPTTAFVEGLPARDALPSGRVLGWSSDHERIHAEVEAPEGGYVVIASSWTPDWKATIDGAPATLHRTNGFVSGLVLPRGARAIELVYDGRALRTGLWLSVPGWLLLAGTLVRLRRGARAPGDRSAGAGNG